MMNLEKNQVLNIQESKNFINSLKKELNECSKAVITSLHNFIYLDQKYEQVSPNQTTLAYHANISREHQNRCIKILVKKGYITKIYRHLSSCIYTLNPLFYHPAVSSYFRHILPNLMIGLTLTLEFAASARLNKNVTQININPSHSVINSYLAKRKEQPKVDYLPTKRGVALAYQLQNGWTARFKKIVRGEIMEIKFSNAIENIKSLSLTKRGKSALMAYADEIIQWADEVLLRRGTKENSFDYLNKLCLIRCREMAIIPDWNLARKLLEHFNFEPTEPFVLKNKVNQENVKLPINFNSKSFKSHKREIVKKVQEWKPTEFVRYPPKTMVISEDKKDFVAMQQLMFQAMLNLSQRNLHD